jgi:hypothetical protein
VIDDPPLAFGGGSAEGFGDDLIERGGVAFNPGGQRLATQRAKAHNAHLGFSPGSKGKR